MIITLVKADFSSKNIGTLGSFAVLNTLDQGLTFNGNSSIVMGGIFSGSIVASEKYMIASVVVSMDNQVLDDVVTFTEDRSRADIAIHGVTGDIKILATALEKPNEIILAYNTGMIGNILADKAWVANVEATCEANRYIDRIELPAAHGKKALATSPVAVDKLTVWVFDANTNTPFEKIVDNVTMTAEFVAGYEDYAWIIPVKKKYDVPVYFGYSANRPTLDGLEVGLFYTNMSGNYLSGTSFELGTPIEVPSSGSVVIYSRLFAERVPGLEETLNTVATFGNFNTYTSAMAGNCWVGQTGNVIPANTNIKIVDVGIYGTAAESNDFPGCNILVFDATTDTVIDWPIQEATVRPVFNNLLQKYVLRFQLDKTYDVPVYLVLNAERTGGRGLLMGSRSGNGKGILMVDGTDEINIGASATFSGAYDIAHAIYN